jgi:hypothetical protein
MLRQHRRKDNKKKVGDSRIRFPGICADAVVLGVTREHLYRVLTGERRSPLLGRYRALKGK